MDNKMNQITNLILNECQSILSDVHKAHDLNKFNDESDKPPFTAIVRFHDNYATKSPDILKMGHINSVWEINTRQIISSKNLKQEPQINVKERFFNQGNFMIAIKPDLEKFVLVWLVGPLYGAMYVYNIDAKNSVIKITKEKFLGCF